MSDDTHRSVTVDRVERGVYVARGASGAELTFGTGRPDLLNPVELLLAAIGGCSAIDVDVATSRRAEPTGFTVAVDAEKLREDGANVLRDIVVTFRVAFPEGADGDAARTVLPRAAKVSHDKECTVSRTVEAGVPVEIRLA